MNLVGPGTLPHIWDRHFADSAQLLPLAGEGKEWLDIGAGAGFPGLVIAVLDSSARLTLVESIAKKCRFLEAAAEALGVSGQVTIENCRIEALRPRRFDIITARALAALDRLFDWGLPFSDGATRWLLPKGMRWADELATAQARFRFRHQQVESLTDPAARIIVAEGVTGMGKRR